MIDASLVAARWYLGELSGEDMPEMACQALESGHDGKFLRRLAGLKSPVRRDALVIIDVALRELGVRAPIAKADAALWMARRVAGEIIEGRIEPYSGAYRIWLLYSSESSELEPWRQLAIDCEAAAKVSDIREAKQNILEAARRLRLGAEDLKG